MDEDRPVTPKRHRWTWIIGISLAVLATAAAVVVRWSFAQQEQAQAAAMSASASASTEASSSKAASDAFWSQLYQQDAQANASRAARQAQESVNDAAAQEQQLASQGFTPITSGIYRKDGNFTCSGSLPCDMFYLTVTKSCPGGVYIEASAIQNGVSVGRANDLTAALQPGDQAVVTLTDTSGMANQFKITSATCE